MLAIAHVLAVSCYLGAAALAAAPFARPIPAPVRGVAVLLGLGVAVHLAGLVAYAQTYGQLPLTGIGPALSFAGLLVAITLLIVEVVADEVSLTLAAAPLAALVTAAAHHLGLVPGADPRGGGGAWLTGHIALGFIGIASYTTAAAAGVMYLVARRELRSRRFGAIFRFFPALETLDRVNHASVIAGWLALTLGVVLAVSYSIAYRAVDVAQTVWGLAAWAGVTSLMVGRVMRGWRAQRAALVSSITFVTVLALYVAVRFAMSTTPGQFL